MKPILDNEQLKKIARDNREKYQNAKPYPHIILDNLFNPEMLDVVVDEFPDSRQIDWIKYDSKNERKLASRDESQFGDTTMRVIHFLHSSTFIKFVEELTGIKELIPDPTLEGGGLHQILSGGMLRIHADFNIHPKTNLDRRLNLIVYLNKNWKEEYGGHFELWNKNMTHAEAKVLPVFNRVMIFSTNSTSYHGHPDPLTCPDDMSRKSIAIYYYTNGRPVHEKIVGLEKHSSLYVNRVGQKEVEADNISIMKMKGVIKQLMPPILVNTIKKIKGL